MMSLPTYARPYLVRALSTCAFVALAGCLDSAEDKPATKPEALKACQEGCVKSASDALGDERAAKVYCAQMCTCLVDARFDKGGKQKQSSGEVFQQQAASCDAQGRARAGLPAR